jgi:hypothetical protein
MTYLAISQTFIYFFSNQRQLLAALPAYLPTDENGVLQFDQIAKLDVKLDIHLLHVPCQFVDLEVVDANKEISTEAFSKIKFHRFDRNGNRIKNKTFDSDPPMQGCGSCFGLKSGCCNTCKEVKRAFKDKGRVPPPAVNIPQCASRLKALKELAGESCKVHGFASVPFFKGTIFISIGKASEIDPNDINFTHTINSLAVGLDRSFGEPCLSNFFNAQMKRGIYKSRVFMHSLQRQSGRQKDVYTVATTYGKYRDSQSSKYPGIYILYNFDPICVKNVRDKNVLRFIVQLMAILGGIFSLGQTVDHLISKSHKSSKPGTLNN